MIDVSYNSVRSGLVQYICDILKTDLLDYLPKFVNHFYLSINCNSCIYIERKMLKHLQYELVLQHLINKYIFIILK